MNKTDEFNQSYLLETESPAFRKTLELCRKAAASNTNILLAGESGTGKEILSTSNTAAYGGKNPSWP